jgi:hypothetical protein
VLVPESLAGLALRVWLGGGFACPRCGESLRMLFLLLLLATLVVLGIVLAVVVVKWLFILAVVAALAWLIMFFLRRIA